MSPKSSAKKRKAPETNQSTLDSFRITQNARSKATAQSNTPSNTNNNNSETLRQHTDKKDTIMAGTSNKGKDAINVTTLLGSFRRQALVDRIEVRNFKEAQSTLFSDSQLEDAWSTLGALVDAILNAKTVKTSFQVAYELCQNLCLYGKSKDLYDYLKSALDRHIQQEKEILVAESDHDAFLFTLDTHWNRLCDQLVTIRNVFMELDRRFVLSETSYTSIIHLGKQLFKKSIMELPRVQSRTIQGILSLIKQDREGIEVDLKLLRSITGILLDLSLYTDFFEPSLIKATVEYYNTEGTQKIQDLSTPDYLLYANERIQQESGYRISTYLDETTRIPLTEAVTDRLIYSKCDQILSQGFERMMDRDEKKQLHILYRYLEPSNLLGGLKQAFADCVKKKGLDLLKDPAKDQQMVVDLLDYKLKLDKVIQSSFDNNSIFTNALKESFESFLNSRKNKPAEMMAKFIDIRLRLSNKEPEKDTEHLMERVLVLFRFLQDKDIFEAFYKRFLSKRLLLHRSVSTDLEKNVLSKIKSECGPDFTKDLELMFNDMEISAELNSTFKESDEYKRLGNVSISVNVLAQGIWPSYPISDIILPANMMKTLEAYQTFYTNKFKGRKLAWRNSIGSCIVKAHFPASTKELSVTLFQTVVLLLFNDKSKDTIKYNDIVNATSLADKELKRVLHSLCCGKFKILIKEPQNNIISENDTFKYNDKFTATATRLKINITQQEQVIEERKETETKVLVDRQHKLEAAVVRIMKAKKQMTHNALLNELFVQLKFPIDATEIKKRIESLIDREYLTRDQTDNSLYLYQS
ncbi:cullin [Halteromyces radiatus]|uniref:cullin n=1 Tax=Halteromyces radiatus TaxID=101107 RepID=UPI00221EC058|nr:cullin [Halteromyces radiatus]KAI8089524.1 cullin [Halteromyces radiatus]